MLYLEIFSLCFYNYTEHINKLCRENPGFLQINLPVHIGLLTNRLKMFFYNKNEFIFGIELYIFRTVSLSIIRSLALYTQQ